MKKRLPPWMPKARVLDEVKRYFLGFPHNNREIYMRRKKLAERLKMSVRTLDRYLNHLAKTKWMETTRRTSRTAFRTVNLSTFGGSSGGSFGGSQQKEKLSENCIDERIHHHHHHLGDDRVRPRSNVTAFPEELELLSFAGVPRSSANIGYIRSTVSRGIPLGHIRGAVCLALRRRLHAGSFGRIHSMKYFAGVIEEIARTVQACSPDETCDCFRFDEEQLKREMQANKEWGAA